jgi:spermidine synthase
MTHVLVYAIFFLSGMCGLVYEVLWARTLGLVFGVTVYATSIVLAAYMSGLAAGSFYFGRFIDRKEGNNLFRYACLEFFIAASALGASFIFTGLSRPGAPVFPAVPLYLSVFILLFIPTFLMGGTLPVIGRYLTDTVKDTGRFTGALYGFNTLGGMMGCLVAGFVLIRLVGVHATAIIAAACNFFIAAIALLLSRKTQTVPAGHIADQAATGAPETSAQEVKFAPLVLVFYGISGFCSLGYEGLWTRALMFNLGNDTYAFSLMLGTFLLGLGIGSVVFSRYVNRFSNIIAVFGLLQLLIGITVFCGTDILTRMDSIVDWLWLRSGKNWPAAIIARFSGAAILMLLPAILIGAVMPVAIRIRSAARKGIGRSIGSAYSANTVGTIIGSLGAAFLLIPLFGITRSILVLASVNIAVGAICLLFQQRQAYRRVGIFILLIVLPIGGILLLRHQSLLHTKGAEVLYYREGLTASVAVTQDRDGAKMLNVNGVYTAYTNTGDLQVHCLLGYLPYFLCPQPEKALVIGFGLGVTAASLHSTGMQVDCVELAKEESGSASFFREYNDDILGRPKFSLIIGDGRHYLMKTAQRYDIITSNAVHVRLSPYLYTKEFYEICRSRLKPHGVVCQWLPSNNLPEREFKQLIRSFQLVFPQTSVWYVNPGHLLLVGTDDPFSINYERLSSRCMHPAVQKKLGAVYLNNPLVVAGLCLLDEKQVAAYTGNVSPHTDDRPCAEFVRVVETQKGSDVITFGDTLCTDLKTLIVDRKDLADKTLDSLRSASFHSRNGEYAAWFNDFDRALLEYRAALSAFPEDNRTGWLQRDVRNSQKIIYLNRGNQALTQNDLAGAAEFLHKALVVDSLFAPVYTNIGLLYQMRQQLDSAVMFYHKAISLQPDGIEPYVLLGSVLSGMGEFTKALDLFRKAVALDPKCPDAYFGEGYCYHYLGDRGHREEAFATAIALGLRKDYKTIAEELHKQ